MVQFLQAEIPLQMDWMCGVPINLHAGKALGSEDLLACAPHGGVLHVALSSGTAGGALLFHLHRRWGGQMNAP